eukprot:UN04570
MQRDDHAHARFLREPYVPRARSLRARSQENLSRLPFCIYPYLKVITSQISLSYDQLQVFSKVLISKCAFVNKGEFV